MLRRRECLPAPHHGESFPALSASKARSCTSYSFDLNSAQKISASCVSRYDLDMKLDVMGL